MNCFQASPPRSSLQNLQRILRAMQTRCSAICSPGELCLAFHSKSVLLFNLAISPYSRSVRKLLGSLTRKSSQACRFHSVIFSNIVAVIVVKNDALVWLSIFEFHLFFLKETTMLLNQELQLISRTCIACAHSCVSHTYYAIRYCQLLNEFWFIFWNFD